MYAKIIGAFILALVIKPTEPPVWVEPEPANIVHLPATITNSAPWVVYEPAVCDIVVNNPDTVLYSEHKPEVKAAGSGWLITFKKEEKR